MATTSCSMCGLPGTDLRSVAGMHKICPQCRWKGEHKCLVKGCTTPNSKVKLKNIPGRLVQATEAVRGKIFSQFGMPSELKQCCKSCFTKLHRATAEFATNLTQATTAHEVQNKGRPTSKADSNIIQGLSTAYANTRSSKERVQILSSVAPHLDNKTMKENFNYMKDGQKISCTSYELTQARLHYSQHGAAATASKEQEQQQCVQVQKQLAFLVEFLHSPECTERSSYKTADCSGKRRSWLSDILVVAHNQFFT
ncbi:hypothetical protein OS493_015446 [Desmophyllum pertusum]|uniref:Uncharacterized protein n=1 Tax=Desmophyllum pertusum TaxID=174260 RepID=A0A9W9Z0L8_9CNID|nr:hypothetical protein OS493_015446 [Desmophyllum pertusum]